MSGRAILWNSTLQLSMRSSCQLPHPMPSSSQPRALLALLPARTLTFAWGVVSAASKLDELSAAAAAATGSRLVLPSALVGQMQAGTYVLRLTATNWLGAMASTQHTLTKEAQALPQLAIVGGGAQTFSVSAGIRVQTAIELASVCSGGLGGCRGSVACLLPHLLCVLCILPANHSSRHRPSLPTCRHEGDVRVVRDLRHAAAGRVQHLQAQPGGQGAGGEQGWLHTAGQWVFPCTGPMTAVQPHTSLPPPASHHQGPVPSVTGGDVLTFTLTATLEGAGSVTAPLTLTAQQSALMAVVAGPRGDVTVIRHRPCRQPRDLASHQPPHSLHLPCPLCLQDTQALVFSGAGSLDPDDARWGSVGGCSWVVQPPPSLMCMADQTTSRLPPFHSPWTPPLQQPHPLLLPLDLHGHRPRHPGAAPAAGCWPELQPWGMHQSSRPAAQPDQL